jgi:hypothetical protein
MVLDPSLTAQANNGRVYMRAARLVERMRHEPQFVQIGPGVPY